VENKFINNKILDIWREELPKEKNPLAPLFFPNFEKNCILFIGLNPSFNKNWLRNNPKLKGLSLTDFRWVKNKTPKIEKLLEFEKVAKKNYPYFNRFNEIAKDSKIDWEHIDLFFYRKTSQNNLKPLVIKEEKDKLVKLTTFGQAQFNLCSKMIKKIRPQVIVVVNALASKIIKSELKDKISALNEHKGSHTIKVNNKAVPIFFSGMLSGQRSLDNGSYERLSWHIRQVL